MAKSKSPNKRKQWLAVLGGLGAIVIAVMLVFVLGNPEVDANLDGTPPAPPVGVVRVVPDSYRALVRVDTIAEARQDLVVRSAVTAPVSQLRADLLPGRRVEAGERLIRLEDTTLRAQLADARNRLAAAELALEIAEREGEQARDNWERSGETGPPPPMVAREPQIRSAQAERDAAVAAVRDARRNLSYATIQAPFSGMVVERTVMPGALISAGDAVLRLQHDDVLDVAVHLSEREVALLPNDPAQMEAELVELSTGRRWPARVRAFGGVMDLETRQETLYLERRQSEDKLRPGTPVEAVVSGRVIDQLYRVPESALTRDGTIWVARANERLDMIEARLVFLADGFAHLALPQDETGALRVAINPVSSFTRGNRVRPVRARRGAAERRAALGN